MHELPRNVRVRPPQWEERADDWVDEEPRSEGWGMVFTPPPPQAGPGRELAAEKREPVANDWSRGHRLVVLVGMLTGLVLAAVLSIVRLPSPQPIKVAQSHLQLAMPQLKLAAKSLAEPVAAQPAVRMTRADEKLRRDGYIPIPGGVLYTPEGFSSSDGSYDLLLHFHGNVKVVVESAKTAKLNAVVAVVNLGVGSARYQERFAAHGSWEDFLDQIQRAVAARGLRSPRLRRLALSSWSAGYGAISTILLTRRGDDPLDAIMVLDGIHCGFVPDTDRELNELQLKPFVDAAHAAASGSMLFSITYTQIDPRTYASSRDTALHLLNVAKTHGQVDRAFSEPPQYLYLQAMHGIISHHTKLEPFEEARVGQLHVRGFTGDTADDHMAHLFQMGATVLPELVQRWSTQPAAAPVVDPIRLRQVSRR